MTDERIAELRGSCDKLDNDPFGELGRITRLADAAPEMLNEIERLTLENHELKARNWEHEAKGSFEANER